VTTEPGPLLCEQYLIQRHGQRQNFPQWEEPDFQTVSRLSRYSFIGGRHFPEETASFSRREQSSQRNKSIFEEDALFLREGREFSRGQWVFQEACALKRQTVLQTGEEKKRKCPSSRANYTDRETAACRRNYYQLLRIEGCRLDSARDSHGHILVFLDQSLSSSSTVLTRLSGSRSRPTTAQKIW
jgi:hypothetical protein